MKNSLKLTNIFALVLCAIFFTCSDDKDNEQNVEYPVSYAEFTIYGPTSNGNYDYRDESSSDEFNTTGRLYTMVQEPNLPEDQIQLYICKSFSSSNFLVVAPNSTGTH
ncbi:hypothetical protein DFQ11_105159 [Winogradskyella epiphytica]|uniref:Uncharacterized protein n=1 Tax=Winogradskyella epiphytica TaxID=262005 RepID=A0A2V4WUZ2_9FLAO|nr:hypothetical protein [Winogradskyella epiphytica]PYE80560.1 hypothetical protein DFQ11_105159 [Winogradskyella epiphytica]GGW68614.1 hypothetical protein GCM10008085_20570 [Winogradskyella epiphytica]